MARAAALALVVCASVSASAQTPGERPELGIRGVTIGPIESSQQPGRGYGTDASAALLDELVRMGASWVSVTPFGRIWKLDSTEIRLDFEARYPENRAAVARMIAQAKTRGLRVLVVPHLWVETEGWRGEIEPGSPERWRAYQAAYRDFVLRWAEDAERAGADAFSIGVECKSWSGRFGAYWTRLIREVRARFDGALTYSANWDEVEDVLFWDDLDWIGINAFYPLAEAPGATTERYVAGARAVFDRLASVARTLQMPVVLVEIGYTSRPNAAVEPWTWPDHLANVVVDEHEQARALGALAGAALERDWVLGFFVWRYYANLEDVSQEAPWGFSPHAKAAEPVLGAIFRRHWAVDPTPRPWQTLRLAPLDAPDALW